MREVYAQLAPLIQQHFTDAMGVSDGESFPSITNASQASRMSVTGSGSSSSTGGGSDGSSGAHSSSSSGASAAWAAAQMLVRQHITGPTAADCLRQAEALWPEWSAAGCRLAASSRAAGGQPSPAEAAAALQAVAKRALPLPPAQRQQQLAKARCVRGLVEALRLTPPRHMASAGSKALTSSSSSGSSSSNGLQSDGAVIASLWALAVLGGSIWWEAEAEALCALLPACRPATLQEVRRWAGAVALLAALGLAAQSLPCFCCFRHPTSHLFPAGL